MKIGTAAHTGISNDVSSTSQVPVAYQQAVLALELSNTVYARFNKIVTITQRDPRAFRWLTELLIVVSSRERAPPQ